MSSATKQVAKVVAINVVGAILAALIIGKVPGLRAWVQKQWGGQ